MSKCETFHVVELVPGTYWAGADHIAGKLIYASTGTPLRATPVDPAYANISIFQDLFPAARFARVTATYTVE